MALNWKDRVDDQDIIYADDVNSLARGIQDVEKGLQNYSETAQNNINAEVSARQSADNALSSRVTTLEDKAHTHGNKDVIDGITADDIEKWNSSKDVDVSETIFGILDEINLLYNIIGVTSYDGGIFGMTQDGAALDGGDFENEPEESFDCGGFEPLAIAVVDGGQY